MTTVETRKGLREAGTAILAAAAVGGITSVLAYVLYRAYGPWGLRIGIAGGLIACGWWQYSRRRSRRS